MKITSNDQSVVETENSIPVIIEPAPWRTWWAYLCYMALLAALLWQLIGSWRRMRAGKAAVMAAEREQAQQRHMNEMIRSFFANISHEFRTPLTMISGPVAQLCDDAGLPESSRQLLRIVRRSTDRMLELVNQQMDFGKLENDMLWLKVRRTDIISVLRRRIDIFGVNAATKGHYAPNIWIGGVRASSGSTRTSRIRYSPISCPTRSNSLPAADVSRSGSMWIGHDEAVGLFPGDDAVVWTRYVKVSVANTGVGIPEEMREKIFERYYRINNRTEGRL